LRPKHSLFSQIASPLNVTVLGGASLLLPLIEHQIATVLFFILRPLTIPLAVIAVAAIVSLLVVIAGLMIGLRVRFLALGPLQAQTGGEAGWSLGLNRAWRYYMGSVLLVPAHGSYTRAQAIISAGTGLLTSAALLILVFTYARSLGWPGINEPGMSTQLETMVLAAPVGAGIVFLAELLTGGTVLSSILRGTPEQAHRMLANMTIASRMASGQRPRDWDPELVEQSLSVPDSTADHLMGRPGARQVGAYAAQQLVGGEPDHLGVELVLAGEVPVDVGPRQPGPLGDLRHPDRRAAVLDRLDRGDHHPGAPRVVLERLLRRPAPHCRVDPLRNVHHAFTVALIHLVPSSGTVIQPVSSTSCPI
jgi:hypothetical protein